MMLMMITSMKTIMIIIVYIGHYYKLEQKRFSAHLLQDGTSLITAQTMHI